LNRVRKHITLFLLLVSALFVVPKELIHEFTLHEDTSDHGVSLCDGPVIESMHHHCDVLQLFVPPYFTSDGTIDFSDCTKVVLQNIFTICSAFYVKADPFVIRGPPMV
jgi:hypothetical protein